MLLFICLGRLFVEKIENIFIGWSILILLSYFLVYIGNQEEGLLYSICGFIGIALQFPTSKIDLLLMYFKVDWIICILGFLCFIIKLKRNNL